MENPTLERLEDQITWYDQKSNQNQLWFKVLKIAQIVVAAFIPFTAGLKAPVFLIGGLGVLIVIIEGLQSLNQYQHNWITYRSTCEELKHEKFLWLAGAGPYLDNINPDALLAERVESQISREHAKWIITRDKAEKDMSKVKSSISQSVDR